MKWRTTGEGRGAPRTAVICTESCMKETRKQQAGLIAQRLVQSCVGVVVGRSVLWLMP